MRMDTGLESTVYARACLSCAAQILNSFCFIRIGGVSLGLTLPWQLLAAHPPGPLYFPMPLTGAGDCGGAEIAFPGNMSKNPSATAPHQPEPKLRKAMVVTRTQLYCADDGRTLKAQYCTSRLE